MSSLLCFICHSTVNHDTNEETREKYREVIGLNLCPDSHLCYICCHILNKLTLFRSVCLKRTLEYPVLFSEQSTLNLQTSDIEIHIQCPNDTCQEISSGKCFQINYDVEVNNDDNPYDDRNQQYVKLEEDNDYFNPDDFAINTNTEKCGIDAFETETNTENELGDSLTLNRTDLCDIEYPTQQDYDDGNDHQNYIEESPYSNEINDKIDETIDGVNEENTVENTKVNKKKHKSKKIKIKGFEKIVLSLEEQKSELEANRRAKKYIEAEFKCYSCAMGFLFKDTYQAHMMRHEESNGEHRCDLCTLRFATPSVLRSHTALHSERYQCMVCAAQMGPRARRRHLCRDAEGVACHLCAGMFRDSSGLQQHLRRVHRPRSSRLYPCGVCGEQCRDQAALRTHMLKHLKKKFACDRCPAIYSSPYTLNRHKKSHDAVEERHYCTCGLSYGSRKSLLAHKRNSLAHQQTVFECGKCPRVLPHLRALEAHERKAHTDTQSAKTKCVRKTVERVVCQLCGKSLKGNSKLNRHLREVCEKTKMEEQCS